jgi:two-component system response regulator DctR
VIASPPVVFVIDDDEELRKALAFLLASRGLASAMFESGEAFLAAWTPSLRGCVLTDVRMGGMSGLQLFERLTALGSRLPCIVLTGHGDVPMAVEALKKGARDFVEKPFDGNALVDKLVAAIAADQAGAAEAARRQSIADRLATLSEREHVVMRLMLAGKLNKVIADELGIAMRTVEVHRARIFEKMAVKSAVELSALIVGHKLP